MKHVWLYSDLPHKRKVKERENANIRGETGDANKESSHRLRETGHNVYRKQIREQRD